jgi:hypothetical protein
MRDEWLMVRGHVHYANDPKWFGKDFTPLTRQADGHKVEGIGTVRLEVICSAASDTQTRVLELYNVLYIPAMRWNGLNYESLFSKTTQEHERLQCYDSENKVACYGLHVGGAYKLQRRSLSSAKININATDFINIYIFDKERAQLFGKVRYPFDKRPEPTIFL